MLKSVCSSPSRQDFSRCNMLCTETQRPARFRKTTGVCVFSAFFIAFRTHIIKKPREKVIYTPVRNSGGIILICNQFFLGKYFLYSCEVSAKEMVLSMVLLAYCIGLGIFLPHCEQNSEFVFNFPPQKGQNFGLEISGIFVSSLS